MRGRSLSQTDGRLGPAALPAQGRQSRPVLAAVGRGCPDLSAAFFLATPHFFSISLFYFLLLPPPSPPPAPASGRSVEVGGGGRGAERTARTACVGRRRRACNQDGQGQQQDEEGPLTSRRPSRASVSSSAEGGGSQRSTPTPPTACTHRRSAREPVRIKLPCAIKRHTRTTPAGVSSIMLLAAGRLAPAATRRPAAAKPRTAVAGTSLLSARTTLRNEPVAVGANDCTHHADMTSHRQHAGCHSCNLHCFCFPTRACSSTLACRAAVHARSACCRRFLLPTRRDLHGE